MNSVERLKKDYPWIQTPLVVGAPMRLIALADMAVAVSEAGMHTISSSTSKQHQAKTCIQPQKLTPQQAA
jgi:NAD(P)H-dependent flavin oxidoreductase YrpB (nitropropane dioxygenase family)